MVDIDNVLNEDRELDSAPDLAGHTDLNEQPTHDSVPRRRHLAQLDRDEE